jgi:hypothetical protein
MREGGEMEYKSPLTKIMIGINGSDYMQKGGKVQYMQDAGQVASPLTKIMTSVVNPQYDTERLRNLTDEGYTQGDIGVDLGQARRLYIPKGRKVQGVGNNPEGANYGDPNYSGGSWDATSPESYQWFKMNFDTLKEILPSKDFEALKQSTEYQNFEKLLSNPKAFDEKTAQGIMDNIQGKTQEVRYNWNPEFYENVLSTAYVPTESTVNKFMNNANFTKKLQDLTGQKTFSGGAYKYVSNLTPEQRSELYSTLGSEEKKELVKTQLLDKKYDRRLENFAKQRFTSEKQRDEYLKENGFKFDKNSGIAYNESDPNNILIPEVYRVKKVSKEDRAKWDKFGNSEIEGYKDVGTKGVYEQWVTDEEPAKQPEKPAVQEPNDVAKESKIGNYNNVRSNLGLEYRLPQVYQIAPSPLVLPSLLVPEQRELTYTKVSPEIALRENQRALTYMGDQLQRTGDSFASAGFSDLAGKMFTANTDAIAKANEMNMASKTNYDNSVTQRADQLEQNRINLLGNYERLSQTAEQNTNRDWRNYYKNVDANEMKAFKDLSTLRIAEAMTPDQSINPYTGQIRSTPYSMETAFAKAMQWDKLEAMKKMEEKEKAKASAKKES